MTMTMESIKIHSNEVRDTIQKCALCMKDIQRIQYMVFVEVNESTDYAFFHVACARQLRHALDLHFDGTELFNDRAELQDAQDAVVELSRSEQEHEYDGHLGGCKASGLHCVPECQHYRSSDIQGGPVRNCSFVDTHTSHAYKESGTRYTCLGVIA